MKAAEEFGLCIRCQEWTSLTEPCCGSGVLFEGDVMFPHYEEEE